MVAVTRHSLGGGSFCMTGMLGSRMKNRLLGSVPAMKRCRMNERREPGLPDQQREAEHRKR